MRKKDVTRESIREKESKRNKETRVSKKEIKKDGRIHGYT